LLQLQIVNLDDHAVDVVIKVLTGIGNPLVLLRHLLRIATDFNQSVDWKSESLKLRQDRFLAGQRQDLWIADAVDEKSKGPLGRDPWVELAQRAGSGITRIGKRCFPFLLSLPVKDEKPFFR
jgi:hypothetical protein